MNGKRVVLLARAGGARERTEAALREAGAHLVATLDPASASAADVRAAAPQAVLVVLDPAAEQLLETFDEVLADPALDVMFEDADVAAKREGWDATRWARHLRAKLQGHDDVLPPSRAAGSAADAAQGFADDMARLNREVAALPELLKAGEPAGTPAPGTGAVLVAAGVGGPDAVRQLLGGLPEGFPRPLLLRQHIDGGQYDKLVRQMRRATAMPVVLAQAGDPLAVGTVHVLPDGLDVHAGPAGLYFAAIEAAPTFAALRPADSALLLLSGADPAFVDLAMSMRWAGGLVLGQSTDNCFDPAASNALVARGGEALGLAALPLKLLERWPA